MALNRVKNFIKEILTFADLNAEFDNILNNPVSLISPLTDTLDMNGKELTLDASGASAITTATTNVIDIEAQSFAVLKVDGTTATPANGLTVAAADAADPVLISTHGTADRGIEFHNDQAEEILVLATVATAVNEITISNAATTNNPTIACTGESDIGITLQNQDAEAMLVLDSVATTKNWLKIASAATSNAPSIGQAGEDDIGFNLNAANDEPIVRLRATAAAKNDITLTNNASGSGPTIASSGDGTDADIDLNITTEGEGALNLSTASDGHIVITAGATGLVKIGDAALEMPNTDGSAGECLRTDGSAVTSFAKPPLPRSYLAGLQITINPDADNVHEIEVSAGECRNTGNDANLVLGTALKKTLDETFEVGEGGGMEDGDAIGATEWFHIFIIGTDNGTCDIGFTIDIDGTGILADAVVAAAGYDKYRRIGSVLTDGTPDILPCFQSGDKFIWAATVEEADNNPGAAAELIAVTVPPDVRVDAILNIIAVDDNNDTPINIYSPDGDNSAPSVTNGLCNLVPGQSSRYSAGQFVILTNTSKQVGQRSDEAVAGHQIGTVGWLDRRGRDD